MKLLSKKLLIIFILTSASFAKSLFTDNFILMLQDQHVHSRSIVELSNGDLLSCWFQGNGERTADDVKIMVAKKKHNSTTWSKPFVIDDTPNYPECNPLLFISNKNNENEGKSWKKINTIDDSKGAFSYPSGIMDKSEIIHIYYSHHKEQKSIKNLSFSKKWLK